MFGWAGTGKTTLAKQVCADGPILAAAYTGKACHCLRQRGLEAYTIHQLIYQPKQKSQERLQALERELMVLEANAVGTTGAVAESAAQAVGRKRREIEEETRHLHQPSFSLNADSEVRHAKLVIVDEVSMVDERMAEDLLSFDTKILVLGDPAQLPPVRGQGWFIDAKPDYLLTEIHRQAQDNPILRLATDLRQGILPPPDGKIVVPWGSVSPEEVMTFEEIIVGRNATRKAANARVRSLLGRTEDLPVKGDRLVCLRNDHEQGLLNGAIWKAEEVYDSPAEPYFDAVLESDGEFLACNIHKHHFLDKEGKPMVHWMRREAQEFDFGYALTCHKAQGSQWSSVLVFDESDMFGEDKFRWLYTACTRPSERLMLVRR